MNKLFNHVVDHMGDKSNIYNTIMLDGSMQHQNGQTIYMLDTIDDNSFYFNSNILNKVEIIKAQFQTIGEKTKTTPSGTETEVSARFALWGFMDFNVLYETEQDGETENIKLFDIFSFGSEHTPIEEYQNGGKQKKKVVSKDQPRKGLRFAGLSVNMTFTIPPKQEPGKPPPPPPPPTVYSFDASKITFDPAQSTPRKDCLYKNFALQMDGLIMGSGKNKPVDQGFLQVTTEIRMTGVQETWNGLRFQLNMGSPGELAGKINLTSELVLAWSPGSEKDSDSYDALVGLKLPGTGGGAKLLSLQGVLKLSIGMMRLFYVKDKKSFLLLLSDIALKFLGIMKLPPNGSSAFYLFGNPKAEGEAGKLGWYAVYKKDQSKSTALTASGKEDQNV
jgi:hypothetical protein